MSAGQVPEFDRSRPLVLTTAPSCALPVLRIHSHVDGAVLHLVVDGELDMDTDGALGVAIAAVALPVVHLDLGRVTFMGCSSLKLLFPPDGTRICIRAASPVVRRLLGLAGLEHLLCSEGHAAEVVDQRESLDRGDMQRSPLT